MKAKKEWVTQKASSFATPSHLDDVAKELVPLDELSIGDMYTHTEANRIFVSKSELHSREQCECPGAGFSSEAEIQSLVSQHARTKTDVAELFEDFVTQQDLSHYNQSTPYTQEDLDKDLKKYIPASSCVLPDWITKTPLAGHRLSDLVRLDDVNIRCTTSDNSQLCASGDRTGLGGYIHQLKPSLSCIGWLDSYHTAHRVMWACGTNSNQIRQAVNRAGPGRATFGVVS